MPTYTYRCEECEHRFIHFHKSLAKLDKVTCPICESEKVTKVWDDPGSIKLTIK